MIARGVILAAALGLLPFLAAGCDSLGGGTIAATPPDWSPYADHTVTVRGNAGNSRLGPIVRFPDEGYIALRTSIPWTIDAIGRPVEVKGKIVSGAGFRAEPWVLDPTSVALIPPPPPQPRAAPTAAP